MPFVGSVRVPSDKSISHRAVLFAGLAQGVSHLEDVLPSADVHATIRAMQALGARVDFEAGPHGLLGEVAGIGCAKGSCAKGSGPFAHVTVYAVGNGLPRCSKALRVA